MKTPIEFAFEPPGPKITITKNRKWFSDSKYSKEREIVIKLYMEVYMKTSSGLACFWTPWCQGHCY